MSPRTFYRLAVLLGVLLATLLGAAPARAVTPATLDRLALGGNGDGQLWYMQGGTFSVRAFAKPSGALCGFAIRAHNRETGAETTSASYEIGLGHTLMDPLSMGMQFKVPVFPHTNDAAPGHYTFTVSGAPATGNLANPSLSPAPVPACLGSATVEGYLDSTVIGHKLAEVLPMTFAAPNADGWFILGTDTTAMTTVNATGPCVATTTIRQHELKIEKWDVAVLPGGPVDIISLFRNLGGPIQEGIYDLTLEADPHSSQGSATLPPCMGSAKATMMLVTGSVIRHAWSYSFGTAPATGGNQPFLTLRINTNVAGKVPCALGISISQVPFGNTVITYPGSATPNPAGQMVGTVYDFNGSMPNGMGPYFVEISGAWNVPNVPPCKGDMKAPNVYFSNQSGTFP